jgi:hypothetical protein
MPKKKTKSKKTVVEKNLLNENLFWVVFITAFLVGTMVGAFSLIRV